MGRVRNKAVKKAARVIIEKYYPRLTNDFQVNKRVCEQVAIISSKRLRNKIAGFLTHLMTRIEKGPVHGISLKMQEEEREKRDNYCPEVSEVKTEGIEVDKTTMNMLHQIGMGRIPGVVRTLPVTDLRRKKGAAPSKNNAQRTTKAAQNKPSQNKPARK
ncbi:putative 40S ribosomal protein S17-1 [Monocercomonoides exilis]|uniref:putative 40S ribosomal protein S17-1 n=1 Tax=Monocercomonoides exilis TaxID=2049356 RepID=UPI00355A4639|nr:putative 40S ribosomal protein S17-1 [Monocercomonoides exilis]|eukprot:MONOS_6203.1-p1 / transcript=MONOS_6203.1 / gene=MONOS_6203 / organism=Monocercomonoides_exilis_PA203 / gene_product=40S ribosomal protein S17-1 / transcript_product=40S ribosomal protein S17-1 / location=Mono_scaffold00192:56741-57416(+) / protein_length=159 / sequence_SO=supercontig / SO=protein_coding / is_pseudo=false